MVTIQSLIKELSDSGLKQHEIGERLNVSTSMVSSYKHQGWTASLTVAIYVYDNMQVVLHPFSEEGLKYESQLNKERINNAYPKRT